VRLLWVDVLRGVGLWLLLVSGLLSVLWVMGLVRVLPLMLGEEDRLMHRLSTLLLSRRQLEGRGREMTRGLAHGDVVPVVLHMTMRFVALLIKQVTFVSFGCAVETCESRKKRRVKGTHESDQLCSASAHQFHILLFADLIRAFDERGLRVRLRRRQMSLNPFLGSVSKSNEHRLQIAKEACQYRA
jgi:hypothetical protein